MASKTASRGKGGHAAGSIVLPADARLGGLDDVVPQLRDAAKGKAAQLDARAVERIDGALLQLLVAFRRAAATSGCAVSWLGASETLREAADLLGLDKELDLPAPTPA